MKTNEDVFHRSFVINTIKYKRKHHYYFSCCLSYNKEKIKKLMKFPWIIVIMGKFTKANFQIIFLRLVAMNVKHMLRFRDLLSTF